MNRTARLELTPLSGMPTVRAGDDIAELIVTALQSSAIELRAGDIFAIAQKIVSKAEGRAVCLEEVLPSDRARELGAITEKDPRLIELILRESRKILRAERGNIIVSDIRGFVMANAGIDASNVETSNGETVLLLPENPDQSAVDIGRAILSRTGVDIGVLINDSFGRAWRMGTIGTAIGLSGMPGLIDLRGVPDRNGRQLRSTDIGAADELAAAASLVMGQADEGTPVVHVRGFPYPLRQGRAAELIRPESNDLFR